MSGTALTHDTGRRKWKNWHENYEVRLRRLVDVWNSDPERSSVSSYKKTTTALQKLIRESRAKNERIRAFGGGWSFSGAPATDGTLINTKPLNYRFPIGSSAVSARFRGKKRNLYFVQCGTSIAELNWYLFDKKKALPTTGASNGQTIVGALSTGTHGAAIDVGAVSDYVVAMHLIVSPTRHVWLERASNPVIVGSKLPVPMGANVIRDDAIFNAALVSFGSFGIIHGVVIEVDNQYFLNAFRKKMPFNKRLRDTMEDLDFSRLDLPRRNDRPYHFQVVMNPFEPDGDAFVTTMYRDARRRPGSKLPPPPTKIGGGDDALGVIGVLTDLFGDLTPILAKGLMAVGYGEYDNHAGTPGQIFRDTTTRGKAASSAMGIPLQHVNDALDVLFDLHREIQAPVLFACRYVKSTKATLGFTCHGERTCVLEIDGPQSSKVRTMHKRSWDLLRSAGIPFTFHWGKQHDLTANRVRAAYGDERVDAWLAARRSLLRTASLRKTFSNDMTERAGLAE